MVYLHPYGSYTKYVQLQEAIIRLISQSTSTSCIHPKRGSLAWGCHHLIYQGCLKWCLVPLPYPKAHVMVLVYASSTYTKSVQLQEAMVGITSPSTSTLCIHPKLGSLGLGISKSDIAMVVEVVWCHCHTPIPM